VLESNLKCFLMDLNGADFNFEQNLNEAYAIVLGSEDDGISNEWSRIAAEKVKIPMDGIVDSLNVSVAGAIILYEFSRQRKNFGK
jgi:TrmH family RNA methyltransferase